MMGVSGYWEQSFLLLLLSLSLSRGISIVGLVQSDDRPSGSYSVQYRNLDKISLYFHSRVMEEIAIKLTLFSPPLKCL